MFLNLYFFFVLQIYTIQIACRNDIPDIMTIKLILVSFIG